MWVVILWNKKTQRKTLWSCNGETLVFDSKKDAADSVVGAFGASNSNIDYDCVRIHWDRTPGSAE